MKIIKGITIMIQRRASGICNNHKNDYYNSIPLFIN